jgi:hypothetical protein
MTNKLVEVLSVCTCNQKTNLISGHAMTSRRASACILKLGLRFFHYRNRAHRCRGRFRMKQRSRDPAACERRRGGIWQSSIRCYHETQQSRARRSASRSGCKESADRRRQRFREMQLGWEYSFSGSVRSVQYVPIEERVTGYRRCFVIGERS